MSSDDSLYHFDVKCQLDCGSTCNTMVLLSTANLPVQNAPKLKNSHVKLRVCDGLVIKPLGKALFITMHVCRQGTPFNVSNFVKWRSTIAFTQRRPAQS